MSVLEGASDREIKEEVEGAPQAAQDIVRAKAKADLYFLSKGVLGRKDLKPEVHGPICRFFEDKRYNRRCCLYPRGHLKTTLGTVDDSVRIVLNDPEARILIANEVVGNAIDMLSEIKGHFTNKEGILTTLFPSVVPDRTQGPGSRWGTESATVQRNGNYKEPTWLAMGVGGAVTSKHFTHIKDDDLTGLEANRSKAELKKAIKWFNNQMALVVGDIGESATYLDVIGTRWGTNDFYSHVFKVFGPEMKVLRRGCFTPNGDPLWPERYSKDFFELMRNTDPMIFYAQYLNDPISEEAQDFRSSHLQYFDLVEGDTKIKYVSAGKEVTRSVLELDRVITVDPNSGSATASDEGAIVCTGQAADGNFFALDEWGGKASPTKFVEQIMKMANKWKPRVVGIEEAGQQNTLHYFEQECRKKQNYYRSVPLKPDNREKMERIRILLEPVVTSRRYFVRRDQYGLIVQISNFPNTDLVDRIDAAAYAMKLLRPPFTQEEAEKADEVITTLLAERHLVTGY